MSSDLKPCPFCGGEASQYPDGDIEKEYVVRCWSSECELGRFPHPTAEEAEKSWNRRADSAVPAAAPSMSTTSPPENSGTDEWKLVPLEPTDAMAAAAVKAALAAPRQLNGVNYWRAMIAASPCGPRIRGRSQAMSSDSLPDVLLPELPHVHDDIDEFRRAHRAGDLLFTTKDMKTYGLTCFHAGAAADPK